MPKIDDVELVNLALDQISQTSLSSLSDGTETAAKCARNYNHSRRCVLRSGRWKSARVKVQLSQRTDLADAAVVATTGIANLTQVGGWPPGKVDYTVTLDGQDPDFSGITYGNPQMAYAFQLPQDYLRLVRFNDVDSAATSYPFWEIRGDILWTNQTVAFLEYVRDVSMPGVTGSNPPTIGTLDPDLQDTIIAGLAARLAWVFQQSTRLQDQLKKDFVMIGSRALAVDARSEKVALRSPTIDSSWIRSRWISTFQ